MLGFLKNGSLRIISWSNNYLRTLVGQRLILSLKMQSAKYLIINMRLDSNPVHRLTHFWPKILCYTNWKQLTKGFLVFSRGIAVSEKCPYLEFSGSYSVLMRENTDQKNAVWILGENGLKIVTCLVLSSKNIEKGSLESLQWWIHILSHAGNIYWDLILEHPPIWSVLVIRDINNLLTLL